MRLLRITHPARPPNQPLLGPSPTRRIEHTHSNIQQLRPLVPIPEHGRAAHAAKPPGNTFRTAVRLQRAPGAARSRERRAVGQRDRRGRHERPLRDVVAGNQPARRARAVAGQVARAGARPPPGLVGGIGRVGVRGARVRQVWEGRRRRRARGGRRPRDGEAHAGAVAVRLEEVCGRRGTAFTGRSRAPTRWGLCRRMRLREPSLCETVTELRDPVAGAAVKCVFNPHVAFEGDDTIGAVQRACGGPPCAIRGVLEEEMRAACCAKPASQNVGRLVCGQVAKVWRSIGGWNGNI